MCSLGSQQLCVQHVQTQLIPKIIKKKNSDLNFFQKKEEYGNILSNCAQWNC